MYVSTLVGRQILKRWNCEMFGRDGMKDSVKVMVSNEYADYNIPCGVNLHFTFWIS